MTDSTDSDPHSEAFGSFMREFVAESDRAAVILGAAKIETLLGTLLDQLMLPAPSATDDLLEGDSPLATFSSRIRICHRLGLVDSHFAKLLHLFRKLRNGFAHETSNSSLSSRSARDRVLALVEPFKDVAFFKALLKKVATDTGRSLNDPGVQFRAVLAIFYIRLHKSKDVIVPVKQLVPLSIVEIATKMKAPGVSTDES